MGALGDMIFPHRSSRRGAEAQGSAGGHALPKTSRANRFLGSDLGTDSIGDPYEDSGNQFVSFRDEVEYRAV